MMYLYKLMFSMSLIMGTIISVSSYSWFGTWMGLEINLLSFIPIMSSKNNPLSSESSMKYFLIQAIGSAVFLFSLISMMINNSMISNFLFEINWSINSLINSTLLLKMGAAPLHFWFPEIIEGLSWINSLILMTWQKISPMLLLSYSINSINLMLIAIILSTIIGSINGLNQTSLRKLMAFSSINHIGWMISALMINEVIWLIYFFTYSFILMSISLMMNLFNIFQLKQFFSFMNNEQMTKLFFSMNFLSLGGLPPFLGFFPKWMIIQLMSSKYMILTVIMIMTSLITLFFYMRIIYVSILMNHNKLSWISKFNTSNSYTLILSILSAFSISGLTIISPLSSLF